jgi:hypothetical protein
MPEVGSVDQFLAVLASFGGVLNLSWQDELI